jgi:hypothetical protein
MDSFLSVLSVSSVVDYWLPRAGRLLVRQPEYARHTMLDTPYAFLALRPRRFRRVDRPELGVAASVGLASV